MEEKRMEEEVLDETSMEMTPAQRKLFEIRMKMNAGRKQTKALVEEEHKKAQLPANKAKKLVENEDMPKKRAPEEKVKAYLNDTVLDAAGKSKKAQKKDKQKAAFGWDVFNQDSLYKGYKKRLNVLPEAKDKPAIAQEAYDPLEYGRQDKVSEEGVERMVAELEHRAQARQKFSRRRQFREGEDVDFINERNRVFNKKAARAFDKYTVEIKQNLERGTAI
ncbi:pre-mRNA-splicing factor syf2 [Thraustotheca clavata]|uniref:Pre-mRNA-splicing factor SYF2 n=1 Tax=Thraustotheca clavata TaxID=74557 RepID=A0A1W0ACI8_9STRA|nr:pre-mRNA-splicing factor syf2 [Thraustotheca clavata]